MVFSKNSNDEIKEEVETSCEQAEANGSGCNECKQLPDLKDSYVRLNADFENYKRRVAKDQVTWVAAGQAHLLNDLLQIVDDFDRALAEYEKEGHSENLDSWLQGFELIRKSLYKFLEKNQVKEIDPLKEFDPELHEAISQIESKDHESGQIVEVVQRGFMFKNEVLRPAKVIVAK